jgi:nitrogen regulatory protein P-II 1
MRGLGDNEAFAAPRPPFDLSAKDGVAMKKIEAIIKPFRLEDTKNALSELGVAGLTTVDVRGFGRQKGHQEIYRGSEYTIDFVPKVMIIVVVPDELVDPALEAIIQAGRTGEIGDGKIFVSIIDQAVRIRTGESGRDAL